MATTDREDQPRLGLMRTPSAGIDRLLAQFRPRFPEPMPRSEFRAETIVSVVFLAAAIPMAVLAPGHGGDWSPLVVPLLVALYAIASRIEFDVAFVYGVPTQLVLVPMLYLVPPGLVPLLVAAGVAVGRVPAYARGTIHPGRSIGTGGNAWHAVGPAAVFALGGLHTPEWSQWPFLLAALVAQVVCDLTVTVALEWLRTNEPPKLQMRLTALVYLVDACLSPIGLAIAFVAYPNPPAVLLALPLCYLLRFFARDRQQHMQALLALSSAYRGTALLLGDVVEADDTYTGVHSRDVVELCMAVGPQLGLDEDQLRRLEFTALLHDVGKIAIPKEIINKPGKLTDEERAIIETHTIEGETLLLRVGGLLGEVGRLVRSCHERYDGLGYPDGLVGEAIPMEARIVCCCDAFNAMTTDRPYRSALSLEDALSELRVHRGTQFDPSVVDCLLAMHPEAAIASSTEGPATTPAELSAA